MLNKKDIKSCRSCFYHKPNSGVIEAKGACYCKLTDSHIFESRTYYCRKWISKNKRK